VAVALDHLRRDLRHLQAQALAGVLLHARRHRGVRADRAGHLPDGDLLARERDALLLAAQLVHPHGELHPERRRLRVHAVRAADADRVLVLHGTPRDHLAQPLHARVDQVERLQHLQAGGRVPDVVAGEPVVDPARLRPERVRDGAQERGHVVVRLLDVAHHVRARGRARAPRRAAPPRPARRPRRPTPARRRPRP
jgi:hypothetical protein